MYTYQVEAIEEGHTLLPAWHGHEAVWQHAVTPLQRSIYFKAASAPAGTCVNDPELLIAPGRGLSHNSLQLQG